MRDLCEVAYCVDIDEAKAQAAAKPVGAKWHTDYLQVLDDVDAVDICTPPHLHAEMAIHAMLRGKHVLTEKVMCTTLEDADEMIRVSEEKKVKLMVAYVQRFSPVWRKLHELVTTGAYGQPYLCVVRSEGFMDDVAGWRKSWKTFPMGALMSKGCHAVDQMIWNFGDCLQATCMSSDRFLWDQMGREDTAVAVFRFKSGVIGNYIVSWGTRHTDSGYRYAVYLADGHLVVSYDRDGVRRLRLWQRGGTEEKVLFAHDMRYTDAAQDYAAGKNFEGECEHFIDCIVNDKEPLTNGRESKKSMEAIAAAYHGEDYGLIARLPLENVRPQFIWRKQDE